MKATICENTRIHSAVYKPKTDIIKRAVCDYLKVDEKKLTCTPNIHKYTEARYYIYYFLHLKTGLSVIDIAVIFRMDRGNVYTALKQIRERMIFKPEREKTEGIEQLINERLADHNIIASIEKQAVSMCQL
jgi:chromosomal replication initiation ATPase DnaA